MDTVKIKELGIPILSLLIGLGIYYFIICNTDLIHIRMQWFFISSGIYFTIFLLVLLLNYYPKEYNIRIKYLKYIIVSYFLYLILSTLIGGPLYIVLLIGKFESNIHLHILIAVILGFALTKLYFRFTEA